MYCFPCRIFLHAQQLKDRTFCHELCSNGKTATEKGKGFFKHATPENHIHAVVMWKERQTRTESQLGIDDQLYQNQLKRNRYYLDSLFDVTNCRS